MDHLPTPADPAFPEVKVPWLGTLYDDKGFLEYPERNGWIRTNHNGIHYLLPPFEREDDSEYQRAFLQSWLWLGLLVEVFKIYNVPTNFSEFTTPRLNTLTALPEGTIIYLTTERLPDYLEEIAARDRSMPIQERRHRFAAMLLILGMAFEFASGHADAEGLHASSLTDDIALSILVLGQTLQNAARAMAYGLLDEYSSGLPPHIRDALKGFGQLSSRFVRQRLQNIGWCMSDIQLAEKHLNVEHVYYASRLRRGGPLKDHSACSSTTCLANQVAVGYETRHISPDCRCDHISVDPTSLDQILQKGGIPAVKIFSKSRTKLEVVDVSNGPYIAISHVWSDGLGNENANSLPECQILELYRISVTTEIGAHVIADEVKTRQDDNLQTGPADGPVPIWIDTLCVPLTSTRRLALEAIGRTFQQAKAVLAIDLEWSSVSLNTPWQELCLRVGLSGYSRRLWTFQEAALAENRLYFQFKEGSLDLWRKALHAMNTSYADPIFRDKSNEATVIFFRGRVKPHHFQGDSIIFTFIRMAQSLLYRTTSKQIDEAFCLASTLRLNTSEILQFRTVEERMREFWKLQAVIPSTVFFLLGTKLSFQGYRWAPRTFLAPDSNPILRWRDEETTRMAQWDESGGGIRVALPGSCIKFRTPLTPADKDRGLSLWVRKATSLAECLLIELRQPEYWPYVCGLDQIVLVLENDMDLPRGFVAELQGDEDGITCLKYLFPVFVTPIKEMVNWESINHDSYRWQADCTQEYSDSHMWCVT